MFRIESVGSSTQPPSGKGARGGVSAFAVREGLVLGVSATLGFRALGV